VIYSNPQLLGLDHRHVILDKRLWKSSADPYYNSRFRLKDMIQEWLTSQNIPFQYGESPDHRHRTIYFENPRHATLFKLTWL
jgi:hypothetical protein